MECLGNGGLPANLFPQPRVPLSAASVAQCHSRFFLRPGNPKPPKHSLYIARSLPRCDLGLGGSKALQSPAVQGTEPDRWRQEGALLPAPQHPGPCRGGPNRHGAWPTTGTTSQGGGCARAGTFGLLNAAQRAVIRSRFGTVSIQEVPRTTASPGSMVPHKMWGLAGKGQKWVLTGSGASDKGSGAMRLTCDVLGCSKPASQLPGEDGMSGQN